MLCMVLLDLCAFACTQAQDEQKREARENYETAYRMAKKLNLPDILTYKQLIEGLV